MTIYHYTCDHGRQGINQAGFIEPNAQPVLGGIELIWLTDMDKPDRFGLGLTSDSLTCDRMKYRYIVPDGAEMVERWASWAARNFIPAHARLTLERGRIPERWFVSTGRLWAERDKSYTLDESPKAEAVK